MRLIHVFVHEKREMAVRRTLADFDVDYAVTSKGRTGDNHLLFEFPVPVDGVEDVLADLRAVGVDEETYTVITSVEATLTPNAETLLNRYDRFRPLPAYELRGNGRSLTHDTRSYVWLVFMSAIIAAVGLLVNSPAIVVGSMVIAPIIGPMLSAGVGLVTDDLEMLRDSICHQAVGGLVVVGGAALGATLLRWLALVPPTLDLASVDLVSVRLAPSAIAVIIGLVAGSAAVVGVLTEGPISIIGVMIAAAGTSAAATAGIAVVWGDVRIALGAALLLAVTVVAINVAVVVTLVAVGRWSEVADFGLNASVVRLRTRFFVAAVVLLPVAAVPVVATQQQGTTSGR